MSNKKQSSYTEKFRREAVRRADEPGVTATQVAKDLGINVNLIYNWRSQFRKIERLRSGETVKHQFHKTDGVDYSKPEYDETRKLRKENAELKEELEFLKKATDGWSPPPSRIKKVKYAFIEANRNEFKISRMCRWLDVSRSGYYTWRKREPSKRAQQREMVRLAVNETYYEFKNRYGAPRIAIELNDLDIPCSKNHVADLLRELGLKARNGKRFKYQPSPEAMAGVADNVLARNFDASKPNEKWVSDITYTELEEGWVYLAAVMDLFSRQVIGWSIDDQMTVNLVRDAFNMAVSRRQIQPGLVLHSDRGVQYRAWEYQALLESHDIAPSMSRKGNCWDNAAMESFFSRLKVELVYAEQYATLDEAYSSIFEYIEVFYNRVRRHSAIGYKSPMEYEREFARCA